MKKITCILLFLAMVIGAKGQIITTVAGNGHYGYTGDGGPATLAELSSPNGIIVDSTENIYVTGINSIRKIEYKTGIISTIAGNGIAGNNGDGGQATAAEIAPTDLAIDGKGNLYFTQYDNDVIRKINFTTGIITTIAGNGLLGFTGDGGPATSAELYGPYGIKVDTKGNIYFADAINYRIRRIDNSTGIITTVAGVGYSGYSGDGGPASSAEFRLPQYIALDNSGSLYVSDRNASVIRKVDSSGIISTIAGINYNGFSGDGGAAIGAELYAPQGIAVDSFKNIYISDEDNERIRKIDFNTGIIHTIAGTTIGYSGDGGNPLNAELDNQVAITLDKKSNIFITDYGNARLREIWQGPLSSAFSVINPVNCSTCNGSATSTPVNGFPPYSYSWSQGGTSAAVSGLCTGYDTVTVTDSYGLSIKQGVTIGYPVSDVISSSISSCANNSGKASVTPVGGVAPFSILWSNGQTGTLITGLSSGTYSVTITDSLGCSKSDSVFVPLGITITTVQTNFAQCNAPLNGEAKVTSFGGGVPPYTYNWLPNGGNGLTATGLSVGSYTVLITDANGCTGKDSITITHPTPLVASFGNYGDTLTLCYIHYSIKPEISGGTQPYTYLWSPNGGTNDTAITYLPGTYSVIVTDAYGCKDSTQEYITYREGNITSFKNVSCYGDSDGRVIIWPASLKSSVTWYPTNTNPTALKAGIYTVVAYNDEENCTGVELITVTQPPPLVTNAYIIQNVSCYGGSDGSAGTTVSGGTPPYTFFWPNLQTTSTATGLKATAYTSHVTDSNGCTAMSTIIITQPPPITLSTDSVADNGGCSGIAWVMAGGGSPPFNYLWTGGLTTDTIQNQCGGYYCVRLTDQNGCIDSDCVTISSPIFTGNAINTNSNDITVFPNPNNGIFTMVETGHDLSVEIYNVLGESVLKETLRGTQGDKVINLGEQPNGVYFYRVVSENGKEIGSGKVIIQR